MNQLIIPFEEFEKAVMRKMFEKKNSLNEILWEQYVLSAVAERKFTGVGFFTDFKVPENAPRATEFDGYSYGDVDASIMKQY